MVENYIIDNDDPGLLWDQTIEEIIKIDLFMDIEKLKLDENRIWTPNTYFDEIIVLTTPRRVDRFNELKERLERENITVTVFEGIDKYDDGMSEEYKKFVNKFPNWKATLGNYAIAKSFINLYSYLDQRYKQERIDRILIFEDDVIFHIDFAKLFDLTVKEIPENWNLWYLGAMYWQEKTNLHKVENTKYLVYPTIISCNVALAVRGKNIQEILTMLKYNLSIGRETTDQTIKRYFHRNSMYNVYVSEPLICVNGYGFSDTEEKDINEYDWGYSKKLGRYIENPTHYH